MKLTISAQDKPAQKCLITSWSLTRYDFNDRFDLVVMVVVKCG